MHYSVWAGLGEGSNEIGEGVSTSNPFSGRQGQACISNSQGHVILYDRKPCQERL